MNDVYDDISKEFIGYLYKKFGNGIINYRMVIIQILISLLSIYNASTKKNDPNVGNTVLEVTNIVCEELKNRGYFT